MERNTVRMTGNSSGIMAMASVTPERILSIIISTTIVIPPSILTSYSENTRVKNSRNKQ
jgi:hypothetical protein